MTAMGNVLLMAGLGGQELRTGEAVCRSACSFIYLPICPGPAVCRPAWVLEPQPGVTGSLTSALERVLEEWEADTQGGDNASGE